MVEITIIGRGGQGGVTLAKLIAQAFFLRGKDVQAFGVYAAERSGAPLQAFVRIDDVEITNRNQIRQPDHVIVLDRTLIGPNIQQGLSPQGWIMLNSAYTPESYATTFSGRQVATVDATAIAVSHELGTRTVPIVNTTMLGAVAAVLGLKLNDVEEALEALRFGGANMLAASEAFQQVRTSTLPGNVVELPPATATTPPAGLFDHDVGAPPAIQTGSWATRQPHRRQLTPVCSHACPAGNDVQGFVAAAADQDYDRALSILLETSPLPGVCGRVCPAPCMEACNRGHFDESVNIRELERYVADLGNANHFTPPQKRDLHAAVVGSGPAGLSAAYQMGRLGYRVSIYEAGDEVGGVLRNGIPTYRLPGYVLDRELRFINDFSIETTVRHRVDRRELVRLSYVFDAVFVATGLQESRSLKLGPEMGGSTQHVMQGIEFLDGVRTGTVTLRGEHVIVIGGGNTAIDAARSAQRLGAASVRIVYRRSRCDMPAIKEEVDAAIEEGVRLQELVMPVRLQQCGTLGLICQRMRLGEPDDSGRPRPVPETTDDAWFELRCDRVILALGQTQDLSILPEGAAVRGNGSLLGLAGAPIICGGDFATNDGTVAAAIGNGRRAALHMHRTLTGEDLFPAPAEPVAGPEVIATHVFTHEPQRTGEEVKPSIRRRSFIEVNAGFDDFDSRNPAADEAGRCFSCGVCDACDRCVSYCPEGILLHDQDGYRFNYDYCKGCGICASQCPRGVIYMEDL
ncbi:MAG: 2-oxoacid:acceptor oxidoreductase family protein [Planctomycetota bacterium]